MDDIPPPAVSFLDQLYGHGIATRDDTSIEVEIPRYVLTRDRYAAGEPWRLEFAVPAAAKQEWKQVFGSRGARLRFRGFTDRGDEFVVNDFHFANLTERFAENTGNRFLLERYERLRPVR